MERFGLVGLPNAGKTALFNSLTGDEAPVTPYPYATTEPNVGVAKVPDDRLDRLAAMSASKKVVPASVQVTDIGGIAVGARLGEGLGNRPLAAIREIDALVFVLRAFSEEDVPGETDPAEALSALELELTVADLESVEGQLGRRRKAAVQDRTLAREVEALEQAVKVLGDGLPVYRSGLAAEERAALAPYSLLTNRPVLAVVNLGEDQLESSAEVVEPVAADLEGIGEVIGICVQLEAEAAQLDPAERVEMLEGLGLGEGALPRFVRTAYHLLGLRTFLTTGEKESRAWTFRAGARAPECAGVIHSDLERGFIRAEVIGWEELLELGSWAKARETGKLRVEGKEYEVQDGDVLEIRFNV